ncbi:RloB family protein [Micromonospora sp. NPDC049836]|uniref:RloB family protein n=1 Tax=Micromonospora sp. NPDC049836 TaxID=3364274 RepID=UPI003798489E
MKPAGRKGRNSGGTRDYSRETDLRRRIGTRDQLRTVLVATNGQSTERSYLLALKQEPWVRPRVVVVVERGSPIDMARGAARRRQRDDFDEAWGVCDVDHYEAAQAEAEAAALGVRLVWSNPCFEVWLLLHHVDCSGYLKNADKVHEKLRRAVKNWDKTALNFNDFRDGVENAVVRAQRLGPAPDRNPSTAVWQLIDTLR